VGTPLIKIRLIADKREKCRQPQFDDCGDEEQ
jgi:hypothetical protein